jgi:hypothetical protein
MSVALGVVCKKDQVLLAVARDGVLVHGGPEKLKASALLEETERLQGLLGDIGRVLTEVQPDTVRVLLPEQTYEDSYARIAPRAALETLVCLASLDAGVPVEMLRRITARSRLGMPKGGRFESHILATVGEPVGKYWNTGRNLASAAALADH